MGQQKEYYAFISYKREDEKWAKWLQDKLEHYRFPTNLNGRNDLPKHIRPTFRDVTDLKPGLLAEEINNALSNSEWLIVVCSPRSAKSQWVCKEAQTFIDLGRADHIIPFVIEGNPFSNNIATECYPEALLNLTGSKELLAANINEMGRDAAAIKVIARMFNLRFDALWQRYEQERKRKRKLVISSLTFMILFFIGVTAWIWRQNNLLYKFNWQLMENQARMVADKANTEIQGGNVYESILALIEILPKQDERPFVPEMDRALRTAYDSLCSMRWTFRLIDRQVDEAYMSDSEKYIVVSKNPHIYIYDYNTVNICTRIELPSDINAEYRTYLSEDESKIYVADSSGVLCYSIPLGHFIGKILADDYENGMKAIGDLYRSGKDCNHSDPFAAISGNQTPINNWATSLFGLNRNIEVLDYCPTTHQALIRKDEFSDLILYDCKLKKEIIRIATPPQFFGAYSDCSFSKDGKNLALTHTTNGPMVFDLYNYTYKIFDCNCSFHYSNWFRFSNSNKFLHSSKTISKLEIIDNKTLKVVDSIIPRHESFVWDAYLNKTGDKCLLMADNELYLYYKILDHNTNNVINKADFYELDLLWCKNDTIINDRFHLTNDENGICCVDLEGKNEKWVHTYIYGSSIVGYACNNKYLLVSDHKRWTSNLCILDIESGLEIFRENEQQYWSDRYYNPKTNQLLFKKQNAFKLFEIIPLNALISNLKKITNGMKLSEREYQDFFLNHSYE